MTDKAKSPILLLIILIVLSLVLAGGGFYLFQEERAKNLTLQEEIEDIKLRQKITETKLGESQKMLSTFELRLQEAKTKIDTLTGDLEEEKSAKQEALAQIEQLRVDLEQQKRLRSDLEDKLKLAQEDVKKIHSQLKELESKKFELEAKIKEWEVTKESQTQSSVELGKIVVGQEPISEKPKQRASTSNLEGKVLVVNKDYNFVVINLGSKDGLDLGDMFSIYQNNKYLGDVKIEKVHDSMSAAGFLLPEIKDKVKEGDKVITKTR